MKKLQFSPKQRQVLEWWREGGYDAVICDGAARSGKTFALSVSFFLWAMARFHRQRFGLCAASINGARRSLLGQARPVLEGLGFRWEDTERDFALCRAYAKIELARLTACYAPALLCEENIHLLPALYRFGWRCARVCFKTIKVTKQGYRQGKHRHENREPSSHIWWQYDGCF